MEKFKPAKLVLPDEHEFVKNLMNSVAIDEDVAKEHYDRMLEDTVYVNDLYQVNITFNVPNGFDLQVMHLSIKRRDQEPIHDWRHLNEIKNEMCGSNCEAIEIYPADDRLVDSANQYHLWVFPPDVKIPIGFNERLVSEDEAMGNKQRPFNQ